MIEPAERWYEAAALDVETSFTLTAWRTKTGIATPRFLFLWQQFHDERDQIVTAWEQAKARGDDGRRDRIAAADRMIRFAFVVHEQLPGAPPARSTSPPVVAQSSIAAWMAAVSLVTPSAAAP